MDEIELGAKLEEHLNIPHLQVQAVWQEKDLLIVFNRASLEHLDYSDLTKRTVGKLNALKVPPPKQITFYSRVLGEEEADWQTTIGIKLKEQLPKTEKQPQEPEILKTTEEPKNLESTAEVTKSSEPEEEVKQQEEQSPIETINHPSTPLKLSDFCFTRNKALIKTDLPAPAQKVAENVLFFHKLNQRLQLELAPVLEDFFKSPDKTSLVSVPVELRKWFENLKKLKDAEFKSQAIWLSRYCYDREKTMTEVNNLFAALAQIEEAKEQQLEHPPETVNVRSQATKRSVNSSSISSNTVSDRPRGSQRFTPDELFFMIGGGLLIGAIGWFLWGTAAALNVFGWVSAIAGIVSGVGTILGNQALKTASGIVLIIVYVIFFGIGFIILWIEFLGWLTGLIIAGGVTTIAQSSGAESITSPKPMRLLVVLTIVVLIGMGYAITTSPRAAETVVPGTTGTPLETVEVLITDRQITMSNSALKTSFAMKVENKGTKPCELDFELTGGGGFGLTFSPDKVIKSGETKTINLQFTNGGIFQLNCEGAPFNPGFLEILGPRFTVRDR